MIDTRAAAPVERSKGTAARGAGESGKPAVLLVALLFGVGMFLFFFALNATSLWDNDESTYAEIAKEMGGGHWLTPMFNHQVWFCHPPLYMWMTAFLFKSFGWNEVTARFFPALFSIVGMLAVFAFGCYFWNRRVGFFSAIIAGTSLQYLVQGRMATMDSMLNTFLLFAFYAAWRGLEEKREKWWYFFFVSCGLATLSKGVFGLAYPLFIFGIYLAVAREWGRWKEVPWIKGLSLYLLIAAPWFVYETVRFKGVFLHQVFYFYTYERVVSPILRQAGPWYYYVPVLLFGFLPWSGFLPNLLTRGWRERKDPKILFLGVWVLATFLFFTFVSTKLPNYIFFLYPPLALLLGYFWEKLSVKQKGAGIGLTLSVVVFLAAGLEVFALQKLAPGEMSRYLDHLFPILGVLAGGCAAALAAELAFRKPRLVLPLMAAGIALFWAAFNVRFSPILESYKPMKPLGEKLQAYRAFRPERVVAYHVPGTASLIFYGNTAILNMQDPDQFFRMWRGGKLYCFMEKKTLDDFKKKMGSYWTLGHRRTLWLVANFRPRPRLLPSVAPRH